MIFGFGKKKDKKEKIAKKEEAKLGPEKQEQPKSQSEPQPKAQLEPIEKAQPKPESRKEEVQKKEEGDKKGWLKKLSSRLQKSSSRLNNELTGIFTKRKLDEETLSELEDLLITSDMGVKFSSKIVNIFSETKYEKDISPQEVKQVLADEIKNVLEPLAKPIQIENSHKPHIILVCGVNGGGKTTTIGKLAYQFHNEGKNVMIAACDTFRAAAVEQLKVWADRAKCELVTGKPESDPASVAYEALEKAKNNNADILIIDTAGRLQNKANLMEQLAKIVRVVKKLDETGPHDSIIVLDATTGQNANSQVKTFKEMVSLTGIMVTKLDGTAKGGVLVSVGDQYQLPIHAIGVGEGINDLHSFKAKDFAESLVGV